jgi:alpha-maltose-1-phosphate synthase
MASINVLEKFFTSSYISPIWLQDFINRTGNQFWTKRYLSGLGGKLVKSHWRYEFKEILYTRLYGPSLKTLNTVYERDVLFDRMIAKKLLKQRGEYFWGFQGSCLESLKAAKMAGKITICELAAAHAPAAVRILGEEAKLHPEWADSLDHFQFPDAYFERICNEPRVADYVIGASQFTLRTLREENIPEAKLRFLPLGFEVNRIKYSEERKPSRPLKLLYAGRVTQRKGIKYLLEAMRSFSRTDVELHVIGNVHGSGNALKQYKDRFIFHPALSQYDLFKEYHKYDAFVLPSVFEGFGLVIVEAMAAGLPVITTANTIGPELIQGNNNGYLVPIRNVAAIEQSIAQLLEKSPDELLAMRQSARHAALQYSWGAYASRLEPLLQTLPPIQ